jgi:hypothetical protein
MSFSPALVLTFRSTSISNRLLKFVQRSMWEATPNSFNNNPVEVLAVLRSIPAAGLVWSRLSSATQSADDGHFNPVDFNLPVVNVTNVTVPGRGLVVVLVLVLSQPQMGSSRIQIL